MKNVASVIVFNVGVPMVSILLKIGFWAIFLASSGVIVDPASFVTQSLNAFSAIAVVLKVPKSTVLLASSNPFFRIISLAVSLSWMLIPASHSLTESFPRLAPIIPYPVALTRLFTPVNTAPAFKTPIPPVASTASAVTIPEITTLPISTLTSAGWSFA